MFFWLFLKDMCDHSIFCGWECMDYAVFKQFVLNSSALNLSVNCVAAEKYS